MKSSSPNQIRETKTSREVTNEFVNAGDDATSNSNSKVLNTLITEYTCISKPNQPPNADTIGDGRYLNSLWVFGNREIDEPESPLLTSKLIIIYLMWFGNEIFI